MSGLSPWHCGRSFHELYSCIRSLSLKAVILTVAHAWDHVWSNSSCTLSWVALTHPSPTEINTCDWSLDLNVHRGLSAHCSSICRERALHFLLIAFTTSFTCPFSFLWKMRPWNGPLALRDIALRRMHLPFWLLYSVTFLGKDKTNPPLD